MIWKNLISLVRKHWKVIAIVVTSIMCAILISQMRINWRLLILHDAERVTVKIK